MSLLFAIVVLVGFVLWLLAALPGTRVPEWTARLAFLIAAVLWFVGRVGVSA